MKMKRNMTKSIIEETVYELTAKDLTLLLMTVAGDEKNYSIEAFVDVPGGGDWSGERLDITEENPIKVRIIYVEEEREEDEV